MAKSSFNHYPFSKASRLLWNLGKYIILFIVLWYALFGIVLNWLSIGLMKLANSEMLQEFINTSNEIIGFISPFQIPSSEGAGRNLNEWIVDRSSISTISPILWLLLIVVVLYIGTIILRHHNREQEPLLNDIEAKWLKVKMRFALGARKKNKSDDDTSKVRKVEKYARKRIRKMKIYIHTRKNESEAIPTKEYLVFIKTPSNDDVDDVLMRKIKNMPTRLRKQSGGVIFGDMERTPDEKWYYYSGSKEAKVKEARSIKKQKVSNEVIQNHSKNDDSKLEKNKRPYNPTFPLDLFIDRTEKVKEAEKGAHNFAKEIENKIVGFFSSSEYSATHQKTEVGNSSVLYRYYLAYSKKRNSADIAPQIQKELSDVLGIKGVLASGEASIITITVPLKEGDEKYGNLQFDHSIPIDVSTMIKSTTFDHPTTMIFGITADNHIVHMPLSKQPHLLIAGETGSGKSVTIQEALITAIHHSTPAEIRLGIVDPKEVDFQFYDDLPYMITNPITDMTKAATFMEYVVIEMETRKSQLKRAGVRNVDDYNEKAKKLGKDVIPYWIIVIDEYADLVGEYPDVEAPVQRLAQKARANGIHLILGMQTPRAEILKGVIKANVPTRIAMKAASHLESNIILGDSGAEKLNLAGDMLVKRANNLERAQSAFITDGEITNIFNYLKDKFEKPVFPDFETIVARSKGEQVDDDLENGKTPYSTTVSTNSDRKLPEVNSETTAESKQEDTSVKGSTEVSTSKSSLEILREKARKKKELSENKVSETSVD